MGRSVVIFGSIPKWNFWRVFDVFLDLVIFAYFNAIFIDFYAVKSFICIYFVLFLCFYEWERFEYLKNFNEFFMYLFRWRKGGGALLHVYVWEHIVSLYYRTAWLMFTKLGRDEVLIVPRMYKGVSARSAQGRIQGGAKIGQRGSPSSRNFFFRPEGYSD